MLKGIYTALVTPFNNENNVDYKRLKKLIDFQIKENISGIVVCGTTGESATLSIEEKKKIIKKSVSYSAGRVPIIAGTGTNNTKTTIELSKYAASVGASALLIVTPYYLKTSQEGLYLHYKKIAENVNIPIIIYNVPSRTGVDISVDTILRLEKIPNIIGIKEASQDMSKIINLLTLKSNNFSVLSGNDDLTLSILALGGDGAISVISNIYPNDTVKMYNYFISNNLYESRKILYKYYNLIKLLFIEPNPIPVKYLMNKLNFKVGAVRLPLTLPSKTNTALLENAILKDNN